MPSSLQTTRLLLAATLVVGLTLPMVGETVPAGADSFPGGNGKQADDLVHSYCHDSSFQDTGVSWYAMSTLDDTTRMTDYLHSSCKSWTDIKWYDGDSNGLAGSVSCTLHGNGYECDRWRVIIDIDWIEYLFSNDWYTLRIAALHEVGHTTGLTHDTSTANAMYTPLQDSTDLSYRRYESHDIGHIDTDIS